MRKMNESLKDDVENDGKIKTAQIGNGQEGGSYAASKKVSVLNPANLITYQRILLSIILLILQPQSKSFLVVFAIAGISDMLDGVAARKLGCESRAGQVLDSGADLMLIIVMIIKVFPLYAEQLSIWVIGGAALVAYWKIKTLIVGGITFHRFIAMHTAADKIAGAVLFLLPFSLKFVSANIGCGVCVVIALAAAVDEFVHLVRMMDGKGESYEQEDQKKTEKTSGAS